MRPPARLALAATFTLTVLATVTGARIVDCVWPGHGTVTFDVPADWTLTAAQAGDAGYSFNARPKSDTAALVQITVFESPPGHPVRFEQLQDELKAIVQRVLPTSVEKEFFPQALHLKQGQGWFVQLTDASLVGKAPVPGDYKVMRNALLGLDDHARVVATMQFDDPKGPEPAAMLSLVSGMRFVRGTKSGQLAQTATAAGFEFTVPESRLRLKVTAPGFVSTTERIGGGTDHPRYFKLTRNSDDPPAALVLSGWFEPSSRYRGREKFWAGESRALKKSAWSDPVNVAFLKEGNWEVIAYDNAFPSGTNCHLRAELSRNGTWIDLHLSLTSQQPAAVAREQLLAILKTIEVSDK